MKNQENIREPNIETPAFLGKNLSFGEVDNRWNKYNLAEGQILFGGAGSGYKAIVRNGNLVAIMRRNYQLLPNEEAVKVADEAAELAGLVPFDEFTGKWYTKMYSHVILNRRGTQAHALYASNRHYTVQGEKMHLGVGVHNSIDGMMGFSCGIFSFRHACANMVFAGMKGYTQQFDQRATLEYVYKPHTKSLSEFQGRLKNVILGVMEKVDDVIAAYNEMAERELTLKLVAKIKATRLTKKVLPDYLKPPVEEIAEESLKGTTEWGVYNDITEAIWHNAKNDITNKNLLFDTLHSVMPLTVRAVA